MCTYVLQRTKLSHRHQSCRGRTAEGDPLQRAQALAVGPRKGCEHQAQAQVQVQVQAQVQNKRQEGMFREHTRRGRDSLGVHFQDQGPTAKTYEKT